MDEAEQHPECVRRRHPDSFDDADDDAYPATEFADEDDEFSTSAHEVYKALTRQNVANPELPAAA